MNSTAGSIAVYLETENPWKWKDPETRSLFLEGNVPSGNGSIRAGPNVGSRQGYSGFIACAYLPEGYSRLVLCLTSLFGKTIEGPWGRCRVVRVNADPAAHPWVRMVKYGRAEIQSPLLSPVGLRTWTPLVRPFSILEDIGEAEAMLGLAPSQKELAGAIPPHWRITSVRLRNSLEDPGKMLGTLELWSSHPMAGKVLDLAILKGFGSGREKGYGHLDIFPSGGSDGNEA